MYEFSRLFRRELTRRLDAYKLTQAEWRTIAHVELREGATQTELAGFMEIKPITLVRLIDRLEDAGWVERRKDPADRRRHRLYLTKKAQPMAAKFRELGHQSTEVAMKGLSAAERKVFIATLEKMKGNLIAADAAAEKN